MNSDRYRLAAARAKRRRNESDTSSSSNSSQDNDFPYTSRTPSPSEIAGKESTREELTEVWNQHFPEGRVQKGDIKIFTKPEILMETDDFVAKCMRTPFRTSKYWKYDSTLFTCKTEPKKKRPNSMPLLRNSFLIVRTLLMKILWSIKFFVEKKKEDFNRQVYIATILPR